ncbi:coiled-coil domain containing protein, putative [Entamoeba invadens IP1]|uniref:Coiled-coil domain containing protein, putative n=1 Tax=Entamoeba invadens IP1 TaxID=370355 RepID=A0A0A1U3V6_ENTIV|nr:coiled-coil domain containing protein, putative [Entamoeba invadens IP1]ELP86289.1 coiled-coil domain containing protein, putative [Entamoeba invadens IP1]|eukprot:XP_004185635.1 coiled-coil domain containing protein, putative [Entamoeba invadens IP1]
MKKKPQQHKHNEDRFRTLTNKTIIQRTLVYVTNIPYCIIEGLTFPEISQRLSRFEYFGQYGEIVKIIPNIKTLHNIQSTTGPSFSAYITFRNPDSSVQCIRSTNGGWLEGKVLNSSLGTTKYCSHFLRGKQCINPECTYLHQLVSERDYVTKDDLTAGKNRIEEDISQRVAIDSAGKNYLPPVFAIEPVEIDLDTFTCECQNVMKMVGRYHKVFSKDGNNSYPVHSSLSPLRAFRYDQSDSPNIVVPNFIFFLYNTRSTNEPEVSIPKEWGDQQKIDSTGDEEEVLEESEEEKEVENKCEEEVKTQSIVCKDYLQSLKSIGKNMSIGELIRNYYGSANKMKGKQSDEQEKIEKCGTSEIRMPEMNEIGEMAVLNETEETSDEIEKKVETILEENEEESGGEEIEEVKVEKVKDEWTTVEKGRSFRKAKSKPSKHVGNKETEGESSETDNSAKDDLVRTKSDETSESEKLEKSEINEKSSEKYEERDEKRDRKSRKDQERQRLKEQEEKRLERERIEKERIEREKNEKLERERIEKERLDKEKKSKEKAKDDDSKDEQKSLKKNKLKNKKKNNKKKQTKRTTEKKEPIDEAQKPPTRELPKVRTQMDPLEIIETRVKELQKRCLQLFDRSSTQIQVLADRKVEITPIICQYPPSYFVVDH